MYNPEIQAALGTQDEDKQNKNKHKQKLKTMNKIFAKYGLFASK